MDIVFTLLLLPLVMLYAIITYTNFTHYDVIVPIYYTKRDYTYIVENAKQQKVIHVDTIEIFGRVYLLQA